MAALKVVHLKSSSKGILLLFFTIFSVILIQSTVIEQAFASGIDDKTPPNIITKGDIYKISKIPTIVPFSVAAIDNVDGQVRIDCDKTPKTVFNLGKTTVRCLAIDSSGNEARISFVVTVGYEIVKIPYWLKHTTAFWVADQMSDSEYAKTLQYLLEKEIIHIPFNKQTKNAFAKEIPVWIKTSSQKWIAGELSDDEFSIGIQWMLERGLIQI
ncbi:MAG TPA: HYR domain-containing protein [Nitrosopumilaceae archaeon]